jgi:hypothetical protein
MQILACAHLHRSARAPSSADVGMQASVLPLFFRSLEFGELPPLLKAVDTLERYKDAGHSVHMWMRELRLEVAHPAEADSYIWKETVIRLLAHASHLETLHLDPCTPAMLAVASTTCHSTLLDLKVELVHNTNAFPNVSYLPRFSQLKTLHLVFPSRTNLTEHPVLTLTGHLPTVENLAFVGEGLTGFFHFLVTCAFDSLRKVELDCSELRSEDLQHLRVFLSAHSLDLFTIQGDQTLDETLDIVRHVRSIRFGLSIIHLEPPYTAIIQAIPAHTQILVAFYSQWSEDNGAAFIDEVVQNPPPLQAVLLAEPEPGMHPFDWVEEPNSCQDLSYSGRRLVRAVYWARLLAKKGIKMLDQHETTMHECGPIM